MTSELSGDEEAHHIVFVCQTERGHIWAVEGYRCWWKNGTVSEQEWPCKKTPKNAWEILLLNEKGPSLFSHRDFCVWAEDTHPRHRTCWDWCSAGSRQLTASQQKCHNGICERSHTPSTALNLIYPHIYWTLELRQPNETTGKEIWLAKIMQTHNSNHDFYGGKKKIHLSINMRGIIILCTRDSFVFTLHLECY